MQMVRERRNCGDSYHLADRPSSSSSLLMMESSSSNFFPISPSVPPSASSSYTGGGSGVGGVTISGVGGVGYIEHPVSKFDTLAGVAIKYGVEVADIKRMNSLVTDLQMFALKSLHIPLPGRHPPSPVLANGIDTQGSSSSEQTPAIRRHSDLFDSLQSLKLKSSPQRRVTPAMSSLQGYYGLQQKDRNGLGEGCEMAVYQKGGAHYLEDGPFGKPSPLSNPPLSLHRKSKSLANGLSENGDVDNTVSVAQGIEGECDNWVDKSIRRRQKSETDFTKRTPEKLLKEDNSSGGGFSAVGGKGLALRPKAAASRTAATADPDAGRPSPIPIGLLDASTDSSSGVRKSSSTPSFQDQDKDSSASSSSIWPSSKWSLKSDLQALSTAAIAMPIFDGLPKPMSGRRNKAALD